MRPSSQEGAPLRPPNDRSMAGRYGQLILSDGIAAIPVALYYKQAPLDLLAQEVWFVSAILARKWNADLPYPDLQEMAANAGITVRQLRRYRASLESRGYLLVQERYDPATGRVSLRSPQPGRIVGPNHSPLANDMRPGSRRMAARQAFHRRIPWRLGSFDGKS